MKKMSDLFQLSDWGSLERKDGEYGGYDSIIEGFEHEVLVEQSIGDYQGSTLALLRDGDRFGLLVYGWGSCSGCDAFQGCSTVQDVQELADHLYSQIKWEPSAQAMREYLEGKDWTTEFYYYGDDERLVQGFALQCIAKLDAVAGDT